MTKSSSFFENSRNASINGGNFVHSENRITQRHENIFHGPIYGYTHLATGDGPVIGYLNQVTISESDQGRGQYSGVCQSELDVSLIENPSATHSDVIHDEPESMIPEEMRIGSGPGTERERDTVLAPVLSVPRELEAEFLTLSPEMQRYIRLRLIKRALPVGSDSDTSDTRGAGHATIDSLEADSTRS